LLTRHTGPAAGGDLESFEACLQRLQDPQRQDPRGAGDLAGTLKQYGSVEDRKDPPMVRPTAPFLMHLIATAQGAPQTRPRRRAGPGQAVATYAAAMQKPASVLAGRAFARSR
jgi:hypothetical protein